jgi:hypothetical protein
MLDDPRHREARRFTEIATTNHIPNIIIFDGSGTIFNSGILSTARSRTAISHAALSPAKHAVSRHSKKPPLHRHRKRIGTELAMTATVRTASADVQLLPPR